MYLAPNYAAERIAERAGELLGTSIPSDHLRGLDLEDTVKRVREVARDEARLMISVSIGEHLPESDDPAEEDFAHLARWARTQFGVEMTPAEAMGLSRREIEDRLADAAEQRIAETDLSSLGEFTDAHYGAERLVEWVKDKFGRDITLDEILQAEEPEDVIDLLMDAARDAYTTREIEHPVDFALEMTMATMRQNPQAAAAQFVAWVNRRYALGWDDSIVRTKMPQQIRAELLTASRQAVESGRLEAQINEAVALARDPDRLLEHMRQAYGIEALPPSVTEARADERPGAVQAFIETVLRGEMVQLERTIILEVLDPAWKDHLYAMDQLRDSIGFRSFSQLDPRIEYKREGSRLFEQFNHQVHERVTDYLFKLRLSPRIAPQPAASPAPQPGPPAPAGVAAPAAPPAPSAAPHPRRSAAGAVARAAGVTSFVGPGIAPAPVAPTPREVAAPPSASTARAAEPSAGVAPKGDGAAKVGRNDPCPCGSGKKYKKCCGQPGAGAE